MPDIEAAVRPGLSALFITKTEGAQHLRLLDEAVSELERERGMAVGSVGFGAMIEHPRALAHIDDIADMLIDRDNRNLTGEATSGTHPVAVGRAS
jgi:citrate lyase subunit beta/citryl-CoA lyase